MQATTHTTTTTQGVCVQAFVHGLAGLTAAEFLPYQIGAVIHCNPPLATPCMVASDAGWTAPRAYHGQTNTTKPPDTTT